MIISGLTDWLINWLLQVQQTIMIISGLTEKQAVLRDWKFSSVQFKMVYNYLCARESPYALHPGSLEFPQRCFWNSSNLGLIDDGPKRLKELKVQCDCVIDFQAGNVRCTLLKVLPDVLTGTDSMRQFAMTKETMKRLKYRCCVMSYTKARKALLSASEEGHFK